MEVFADADYASKAADRRSVSGGLVMCGGGCISWFSRTQKCVTLSTTEAEYVSLADGCDEGGVVSEASEAFHVARSRYAVYSGVRG